MFFYFIIKMALLRILLHLNGNHNDVNMANFIFSLIFYKLYMNSPLPFPLSSRLCVCITFLFHDASFNTELSNDQINLRHPYIYYSPLLFFRKLI